MIPTITYFNKILIDTLKAKESFVDIFEDKEEIIYNFVICSFDISPYNFNHCNNYIFDSSFSYQRIYRDVTC